MKFDRFRFFISGHPEEINPGNGFWDYPLSGKSNSFIKNTESSIQDQSEKDEISVGDFFDGCFQFLSNEGWSILIRGISACQHRQVLPEELCEINLFLEKHGAFYHPLKIEVTINDGSASHLVLNGTVSKRGLALIKKESDLLLKFSRTGAGVYLPEVYGAGFVESEKGTMGFFLGQWLDGFKEFHLTRKKDQSHIVVWESDGTRVYYPIESAAEIYGKAAEILTYLYNIETCEQVFPWHHAAGDFIVKENQGSFDVRLITIRGYGVLSPFEPDDINPGTHILPSLLYFFIQLTFWMRLDRLDGVNDYALADDIVLPNIIKGFLNALDRKSGGLDYGDLKTQFLSFLNQFDLDGMKGFSEKVINSYPAQPKESQLLLEILESHCSIIETILKSV